MAQHVSAHTHMVTVADCMRNKAAATSHRHHQQQPCTCMHNQPKQRLLARVTEQPSQQ